MTSPKESRLSKRNRDLRKFPALPPKQERKEKFPILFDSDCTYINGVFIDDERMIDDVNHVPMPKVENWHIVRTLRSFRDKIDDLMELPTDSLVISFDYNLFKTEGNRATGVDCLYFLLASFSKERLKNVGIQFHSSEAGYRDKMRKIWTDRIS